MTISEISEAIARMRRGAVVKVCTDKGFVYIDAEPTPHDPEIADRFALHVRNEGELKHSRDELQLYKTLSDHTFCVISSVEVEHE